MLYTLYIVHEHECEVGLLYTLDIMHIEQKKKSGNYRQVFMDIDEMSVAPVRYFPYLLMHDWYLFKQERFVNKQIWHRQAHTISC